MLCFQIVLGIWNLQTQAELLKLSELELQRCIDMYKLMENTAQHSQVLRPEQVHKLAMKMQKSLQRKAKLRKERRFCTS